MTPAGMGRVVKQNVLNYSVTVMLEDNKEVEVRVDEISNQKSKKNTPGK